MSVPKSLFDVYLGDTTTMQGYRTFRFLRDSAPLVASRFSSGASGETDLDLLKSASLVSLEGGMFQRDWDDVQKVARGIGMFNKYDKNIYPTVPRSAATAMSAGYNSGLKVETPSVSFFTLRAFSAGTYYNLLYMITLGGGVTNITLPAGQDNNGFCNISGLCLHKDYLFVGNQAQLTGSSVNARRYNIAANTWQDITGAIQQFFTLRNLLYGVNASGDIFSVTNEEAAGAATYTQITKCGQRGASYVTDAQEFNGAAYVAKSDGIFRFDGVTAVKILNLYTTQLHIFNGAMYFFAGSWFYKFDGVTLTRLQFFGTGETPITVAMAADSDYLYISTTVLTPNYASGDKGGGTSNALLRVYTYDGVGFLLLNETEELNATNTSLLVTNQAFLYQVFTRYDGFSLAIDRYNYQVSNAFVASAVTTASKLEYTISEHDDGFPNIFKALELIEPLYNGLAVGDVVTVKYSYYDGKTWSAWQTLPTLGSTSLNRLEITDQTKKLYKRLKINVVVTPVAGSTVALKGGSFRYTLQPRIRWRWNIGLMAQGNGSHTDRGGTKIDTDANLLNNLITQAIKSKTPYFMLSPDYGIVHATINSAAVSLVIKGRPPIYTDPYNEYPLVAAKNDNGVWEILRVSAVSYDVPNDRTTLTLLERGYLGITAAQISANAEFHLCYKVYITRLLQDQTILDPNTYKEQTTGESQLQRQFLIEAVEV